MRNHFDIWSPSEGQMKCFVTGHTAAYRTVEKLGWMRFEFPEHSRVVIMRPDWNKMVVLDTKTKAYIWQPYPHEHTPAYAECKAFALFVDDMGLPELPEPRLLPLDRSQGSGVNGAPPIPSTAAVASSSWGRDTKEGNLVSACPRRCTEPDWFARVVRLAWPKS